MELCASCKQRVEDGSIRCPNCGADLYLPGAFTQVLGWVLVGVSAIPFAIAEVTTTERNLTPLFLAIGILVLGLVLAMTGRMRSKAAHEIKPRTIPDTSAQGPPAP